MEEAALANVQIPERVFIEMHDENDACDVIVQMDDGTVYTALFATLSYLHRQMQLSLELTQTLSGTTPVRYAILDTPHVIVEGLDRDTIEDTIDNLMAMDIFESHFTLVTEKEDEPERTTNDGKRATQEVAAVVISDVLLVDG